MERINNENRVLVVDDEKKHQSFLFKALTRIAGFQVELANDAEEALEKIKGKKFDLVLTDLMMPKMDAFN